jgi:hypothetical protein
MTFTETLNTTQPPVRAQKGNTVTEVKDSFEGRVTGIVERVSPYARGLVAVVAFHANEKDQYPSRVTVWADSDAPDVGTRVKVTGRVSWRVEEYNGKHRAQVSINFPTWEVLAPAAPAPISAHDSDDTPF